MSVKITMEFENEEQAYNFFEWLCDAGGEQEYWEFCEHEEEREKNSVAFDYFAGSDEFLGNNKVICKHEDHYELQGRLAGNE